MDSLRSLHIDASFCERASLIASSLPKEPAPPLEEMFAHMQQFTTVRRREVRIARLQNADRDVPDEWRSTRERLPQAVEGFCEAVKILSEHATRLQSVITPELDDVIALAADEGHPLRSMLREAAVSLGFSNEEAGWLLDELKVIKYRPVKLICNDSFDDLMTLLSGVSVGEGGLLLAGFMRFTGDPYVDERLENLIIRVREQGVTANIFLVLTIVLVAHAVAMHHAAK
jgi:hypothetical protein